MTTIRRRTLWGALVVLLLGVTAADTPLGFSLLPNKWPNGTVTMHLQLGSASSPLVDGLTSWNQVATNALATWNTHIDLVKFSAVPNSTASRAENDGRNSVFFDSAVFGDPFDRDTLAIATSWYRVSTGAKIEGDVVFNNAKSWNSYRGNFRTSGTTTVNDLMRVALHEFGHILGLDHPDE
ncbi:MAG: matrixin family metalloprotease, partial [Acidobacteriota bacterium]|nr:matrixin family metalloprotease [Acidobacteriota bacterium]